MNWKNFLIVIAIGVMISAGLVLTFQRWPHLMESNWTMLCLFLLAILCSRLMRRFLRK